MKHLSTVNLLQNSERTIRFHVDFMTDFYSNPSVFTTTSFISFRIVSDADIPNHDNSSQCQLSIEMLSSKEDDNSVIFYLEVNTQIFHSIECEKYFIVPWMMTVWRLTSSDRQSNRKELLFYCLIKLMTLGALFGTTLLLGDLWLHRRFV